MPDHCEDDSNGADHCEEASSAGSDHCQDGRPGADQRDEASSAGSDRREDCRHGSDQREEASCAGSDNREDLAGLKKCLLCLGEIVLPVDFADELSQQFNEIPAFSEDLTLEVGCVDEQILSVLCTHETIVSTCFNICLFASW